MNYNSYTKAAKEKFANKVIEVVCPTDYLSNLEMSYRKEFAISVFLAGGVIPGDDWRKEVVKYFQENWKEEKGIIFFNPVREDFNLNDPDDVKKQIEWEFSYLNFRDMLVSFYFPPTEYPQAMSFYELGRALGKRKETNFGNWFGEDVYVCVDKDFKRKNDVIVQGTLANYGDTPHEVENAEHFAESLMSYIKKNYDTNIPLESSSERNCFLCKYFSEFPCHGSTVIGDCLKKENMVWCSPTRYNGKRKEYKTVSEDDVCKFFENEKEIKTQEIEKICWSCEHYVAKTINCGYCGLDETKIIKCITDICNKNI